jgi:hypothetical protein
LFKINYLFKDSLILHWASLEKRGPLFGIKVDRLRQPYRVAGPLTLTRRDPA